MYPSTLHTHTHTHTHTRTVWDVYNGFGETQENKNEYVKSGEEGKGETTGQTGGSWRAEVLRVWAWVREGEGVSVFR